MGAGHCHEWLCLLNPLYTFSDEEGEGENPSFLVSLEHDCEGEDPFRLPPDFDPLRAYYAAFDSLDNDSCFTHTRFGWVIGQDTMEEAYETLLDVDAATHDVDRCFRMYRVAIRAQDNSPERQEALITEYEFLMDLHCGHEAGDLALAQRYREEAQSAANGREARLLHYHKALFFTHRAGDKAQLRHEYLLYCEGLPRL
jgi:hypothetical protein